MYADYPHIPDLYGILTLSEEKRLQFIPMDEWYPAMFVAEIWQEVYDKIKLEGGSQFSLNLDSKINEKFINSTFFKARLYDWTMF